jgi:hypothetical protein
MEIFYFIKISTQMINNFSKFRQNKKLFNLCRNGKGTTIFLKAIFEKALQITIVRFKGMQDPLN